MPNREFQFNDVTQYDQLRERCKTVAEGQRLSVQLADSAAQNPQGLAHRLNADLRRQGICVRNASTSVGRLVQHNARLVVTRRQSTERINAVELFSSQPPSCLCGSQRVNFLPFPGGYLRECVDCSLDCFIPSTLLTQGEREWLIKHG